MIAIRKFQLIASIIWQPFVIIFLAGLFFGLQISAVQAATAQAVLEIDSSDTDVVLGDTLTVSVILKAGTQGASFSLNRLTIPGLKNFSVQGSYSQTKLQSINGAMAAVTQQTYTLVANQIGDFTLGPIMLNLPGSASTTQSNVVNITVHKEGLVSSRTEKTVTKQLDKMSPSNQLTINNSSDSPSFIRQYINTDTVLVLILIVIFGYLLYLQSHPSNNVKKEHTIRNEVSTKSTGSITTKIESNETEFSEAMDTHVNNDLFPIPILISLPEKDLYSQLKEIISTQLTNASETLTTEQQASLEKIRNECDVGAYAPPNQERQMHIMEQLKNYNQTYGNRK